MPRADTLAVQAYQAIRLAMLHGTLQPGEFYSENWLASVLGVSRTPAREALRQMEAEGLIEVFPQRGFRLRTMSRAELVEFYHLRELMESYVVQTLCQLVDDRSIRLLRHILERQEIAADDVNEFINLDEEFHLSLARMAGLPRTARIIASLRGVLWLLGTKIVYREGRRHDVVAEHRAVLTAIEQRDAVAAVRAITTHIRETAREALARHAAQLAPPRDDASTGSAGQDSPTAERSGTLPG